MRDYGIVSPQFWVGKTGRSLRGDVHAQLLAVYLMTSPHANMIGVYYCPVDYMAKETGIPIEGASKALQRLVDEDFCTYDDEIEWVFVHKFAEHQIGAALKPGDKRAKGVINELAKVPACQCKTEFFRRYSAPYDIKNQDAVPSPFEAPPKPGSETEAGSETETGPEINSSPAKLPTCPKQDVIDLYHEVLPEMPPVRIMTSGRNKALDHFWKFVLTSKKTTGEPRAQSGEQALAWIRSYFETARNNDFLMARLPRTGAHANWKCDLDFLLCERGMKHVIEKTEEFA